MNSLHSHPLHATSPEGLTSYLRGTQRHSHTTVGRSTVLARSPAQREMQTSITASMLFAVFAMLVTAGMFVSPAEAATRFGTATASTGRDSDSRVTHSGRVQALEVASGTRATDVRVWNVGGGGLNQTLCVESAGFTSAAASNGQWVTGIQSNVEASSFLTSQGQTDGANLLAINLTLSVQIGKTL